MLKTKCIGLAVAVVVAVAAGSLTGCNKSDTEKASDSLERGADKTKDALKNAAEKTGDAIKKAGEKVKDATTSTNK